MAEVFTTKQAADYLGVTQEAVASLIRRGHLSATEPLGKGRGYLIPAAEVRARKKLAAKGQLPTGGRPAKNSQK